VYTKEEQKDNNERALKNKGDGKKYGLWDFFKFTFPFLWKGGWVIRM
jgi:hypothetical protein